MKKTIEEELRFDLNDKIEEFKLIAENCVNNPDLGKGLSMYGKIDRLRFDNFYIDSDRITLYIYANGHSGIMMK
ncbi:MAG: DUF4403 family protein [Candidatus Delongbacteria bacterium]|nr:DUF4403 family protein [Candidatus Delongbacteria bacterium]MBN2835982.1 DUF4403 family protein [Candidatus Delongbacteria bacterium]